MAHHSHAHPSHYGEVMSESSTDTDEDIDFSHHHRERHFYDPRLVNRELVHHPIRHGHIVHHRPLGGHTDTSASHSDRAQVLRDTVILGTPSHRERSISRGRAINVEVVNNVNDQQNVEDTQSIHSRSPSRSPCPPRSRPICRHRRLSPCNIHVSADLNGPWGNMFPYPNPYPIQYNNPSLSLQQLRNTSDLHADAGARATAICGDFRRGRSHSPYYHYRRHHSTSPHWGPHIPPKEEERKLILADWQLEQQKTEDAKQKAVNEWKLRVDREEKELNNAIKSALNEAEVKENKRKEAEKILKAQLAAELAAEQRKKDDEKRQKEAEEKALKARLAADLAAEQKKRDDEKIQKEIAEKALKAQIAADLAAAQKKAEDEKKQQEAHEKALKAKIEADLAAAQKKKDDEKKQKEADDKVAKAKFDADQAAELKKKEDEKQKKEAEMKIVFRERMAKAGYHNKDIEATIEAKETHFCHTHNRPHPCSICITTTSHTVETEQYKHHWYKVRRDKVSTETLRIYGLDWEYDPDDEAMIIIRSDPGSWDIDELYRHSHRHYEYDRHKRSWFERVLFERRDRSRSRSRSRRRLVFVRRH